MKLNSRGKMVKNVTILAMVFIAGMLFINMDTNWKLFLSVTVLVIGIAKLGKFWD